jgi:uncharacterized membrane protein
MKLFKLAFKRETALPMIALLFASGVSVALVVAKIIAARKFFLAFLVWNLFLAWLPLVLALLACDEYQQFPRRTGRFIALSAGWLLFFPNAPYIFTDLIHLTVSVHRHYWVDMVLILACALTGLVIGFVSLFLMHSLVRRRFGWLAGWLFSAAIAGLTGIGIYLGRFLRLNSWDVVLRPFKLFHGLGNWLTDPWSQPTSRAFPVLFAAFLFIAYVMLYALTHLRAAEPLPVAARQSREPQPAET